MDFKIRGSERYFVGSDGHAYMINDGWFASFFVSSREFRQSTGSEWRDEYERDEVMRDLTGAKQYKHVVYVEVSFKEWRGFNHCYYLSSCTHHRNHQWRGDGEQYWYRSSDRKTWIPVEGECFGPYTPHKSWIYEITEAEANYERAGPAVDTSCMTYAQLNVLTSSSNEVSAWWWCQLNSRQWPALLPDDPVPAPDNAIESSRMAYLDRQNGNRDRNMIPQIMGWIENKVGTKAVLKCWNTHFYHHQTEVEFEKEWARTHPPKPTKVGVNDIFKIRVTVNPPLIAKTIFSKTDPVMRRFYQDRLTRARTLEYPLPEDGTRHVREVAEYYSTKLRQQELDAMAKIENDMARRRAGEKVAFDKGIYDLLTNGDKKC